MPIWAVRFVERYRSGSVVMGGCLCELTFETVTGLVFGVII